MSIDWVSIVFFIGLFGYLSIRIYVKHKYPINEEPENHPSNDDYMDDLPF